MLNDFLAEAAPDRPGDLRHRVCRAGVSIHRGAAGVPRRLSRSSDWITKRSSKPGKRSSSRCAGTEREFEIKSERTLTYEDGSAKHINVEITVRRTEGRVFVITAKEAQAGPKQVDLQLSGGVKVSVSDGFELMTERGHLQPERKASRGRRAK